ncbi:MAG: NADH-quinone oxidoreductase subunit I [Myxococcales bacterium]|jgi:NADH-quinone oxidoreductase subunit I|nr:NADH-quinone oxidoreductase subunit I [Myxococcales bacterium]HRC54358.1 NADH-quinone oxidoreductase subunit I [Kofleriaceae bacterium]
MSSSHAHDESAEPQKGPKVLAVSPKNPNVRTIQVVRPENADTTFLAATATGLGITIRHFGKNLLLPRKSVEALGQGGAAAHVRFKNDIETIQYPEEKVQYPERYRGLHRLMLRDDGAVRCVACMCCPTVCPAHCITIVPEESSDPSIEKRPAVFEIDELRCVVCGLCVEACPCDAIRMDTAEHAKPVEERWEAVENKASLMGRGIRSTATQGGEGPTWRDKK